MAEHTPCWICGSTERYDGDGVRCSNCGTNLTADALHELELRIEALEAALEVQHG